MSVLRRILVFNDTASFQLQHYDVCPTSIQTRLPFPVSSSRSINAFHLLHLDVWGPYDV